MSNVLCANHLKSNYDLKINCRISLCNEQHRLSRWKSEWHNINQRALVIYSGFWQLDEVEVRLCPTNERSFGYSPYSAPPLENQQVALADRPKGRAGDTRRRGEFAACLCWVWAENEVVLVHGSGWRLRLEFLVPLWTYLLSLSEAGFNGEDRGIQNLFAVYELSYWVDKALAEPSQSLSMLWKMEGYGVGLGCSLRQLVWDLARKRLAQSWCRNCKSAWPKITNSPLRSPVAPIASPSTPSPHSEYS